MSKLWGSLHAAGFSLYKRCSFETNKTSPGLVITKKAYTVFIEWVYNIEEKHNVPRQTYTFLINIVKNKWAKTKRNSYIRAIYIQVNKRDNKI